MKTEERKSFVKRITAAVCAAALLLAGLDLSGAADRLLTETVRADDRNVIDSVTMTWYGDPLEGFLPYGGELKYPDSYPSFTLPRGLRDIVSVTGQAWGRIEDGS